MSVEVSLAVVIGRFQYHSLTPGHLAVLAKAKEMAMDTLVLVGRSPTINTRRDPLDYETRFDMIRHEWPTAIVHPLDDHPNDAAWVADVDRIIASYARGTVKLFGGDDCCMSTYQKHGGRHNWFIVNTVPLHATELRSKISRQSSDQAFRAGVIYASERRFVATFPVVDALVYRDGLVMLAGKATDPEDRWRLIGGFVDAADISLEAAARREVFEETGIDASTVVYGGSAKIRDWRYRGPEGVMSAGFTVRCARGVIEKAADDIERLAWFKPSDAALMIVNEHVELFNLLVKGIS